MTISTYFGLKLGVSLALIFWPKWAEVVAVTCLATFRLFLQILGYFFLQRLVTLHGGIAAFVEGRVVGIILGLQFSSSLLVWFEPAIVVQLISESKFHF